MNKTCYSLLAILLLNNNLLFPTTAISEDRIDFNRDIKPLFSETCYTCHGPDKNTRETDLRLDTEESVFAELDSGTHGIVKGKPEESEVYLRLTSKDSDMVMPPEDAEKKLAPKQIKLIKQWIVQGAEWKGHWSYTKPVRPEIPKPATIPADGNEIDAFIQQRLLKEGLTPSKRATKEKLIRRVTLDLTGLPPTLKEIDAFLNDNSPGSYEKLVDRLLDSKHYGEQQARFWLDVARYGDTHGLHLDNERSMWPYRDWVISSFNKNDPFDEFTINQLAGDLLPKPSQEQLIASGYNRCNVSTSEGGSINEEVRVRYAIDRVETLGITWLAISFNCTVCHDHKYDPISQKEFYQLFAFYSNIDEKPMDGNALLPPPSIQVPTKDQKTKLDGLNKQIASAKTELQKKIDGLGYKDPGDNQKTKFETLKEYVWIDDSIPAGAVPVTEGKPDKWEFVSAPDHPVYSGKKSVRRSGKGRVQQYFTKATTPLLVSEDDVFFTHVYIDPADPPHELMLQFYDTDWQHRCYWGRDIVQFGATGTPTRLPMGKIPEAGKWVRLEVTAKQVGIPDGTLINGWALTQVEGTVYWDKSGINSKYQQGPKEYESQKAWELAVANIKKSNIPKPILVAIKKETKKRSTKEKKDIHNYFLTKINKKTQKTLKPQLDKVAQLKKKITELNKHIPNTLVMKEKMDPTTETFILTRGEYDKQGEKVTAGIPSNVGSVKIDGPPTRLTLAKWIVHPDHPLTARVTMNRIWQQYFGTGIVKTAEDFGSQGEWPSHPKLLDWLAVEFIESGWDVKHMHKLIVMSSTYQQTSNIKPEHIEKDPFNRLLARGPRYRLDAEMLRDNALAISGLLKNKMGGRGVSPYQPLGIWKEVGYTSSNTANYKQSHGDDLYRRSIYTFWKRTSPPPTMITFDAPSREACSARRARTNTPLQALILMNETQYIEAARILAERLMKEAGDSPEDKIIHGFRICTGRIPNDKEISIIKDIFKQQLEEYKNSPEAAKKLLNVGEAKSDKSLDTTELAAWTMVANLLLNLDETVTKN